MAYAPMFLASIDLSRWNADELAAITPALNNDYASPLRGAPLRKRSPITYTRFTNWALRPPIESVESVSAAVGVQDRGNRTPQVYGVTQGGDGARSWPLRAAAMNLASLD